MQNQSLSPEVPAHVERPLLPPETLERVRDNLTLAGFSETSAALLSDVTRHAAYVERCSREADAVLHGDLGATTRLWLLLNQPIDAGPALPSSVLDEIASGGRQEAPRAIDGDALLRLVAGVVRAANQPPEVETMLEALGRLLRPLFLLDLAAAAAERAGQGDTNPLRTFVTAHASPEWRNALARTPDEAMVRKPPTFDRPVLDYPEDGGLGLDENRANFDPASWTGEQSSAALRGWDLQWRCVGDVHTRMSEIDRFGGRYTIDSLSNIEACPGQTITIRGQNFGHRGRVSFPYPDVSDPAFGAGGGVKFVGVEPTRWTDTEVDVVVPSWATVGELRLAAFTRYTDLCTTIDVYRLGNSILFQGGLAGVYKVYVAGVELDPDAKPPHNLAPGDSVALTWQASSGPTVRLTIQLMDGATELWKQTNLLGGYRGTVLTVPDPEPHVPRGATLVFTATSACGATQPLRIPVFLSVPPTLTIQYVEVTQGVQGDLGDILAGRGMPTVADKDTAVRVHMNCDRGGWYGNKLDRITGALIVDGHWLSPTNVRVVVPDRGFAGINGLSKPQFTNDTLNFTIPAAWLTPGRHTLTVRLVCDDPSGRITIAQNVDWTWIGKSPMRVRALWMALYGDEPTMLDYTRQALDYLPTALTDIGIAGPRWFSHAYDLGTDEGWNDLLDDVEDEWDDADEESGVRWLGIIPASERRPGMSLAWGGLSGTPSIAVLAMGDRPLSGAHELGHSYGLHHINLPAGVPKGPFDPADNGGMLQRPGFDVRAGTAISLPAADLMSYFPTRGPGISTWLRLVNNL
jgi:hypothetical protein